MVKMKKRLIKLKKGDCDRFEDKDGKEEWMDAWPAMEEHAGRAVMKTPATRRLLRRILVKV